MSVPINEPAYQKLLAELTPDEQAPIVRALVNPPEGMQAIRILAGAGSGKTRTLIAAVVTALAMGLPPQSLLVITFTVAAEEELKKRLKDYIPAAVVDTMKVLTFHKLAGRWAKANAGRLAREFPHKFDGSRKIDEKSVAVAAEFSKFDVVKVTIDGTEYTTKVLWAGRGRIGVKLPGDRDMRWLNASEATLVSGQGGGDEEKPATALPINQDRLIGRIYNAPYRRWDPRAEREVEEEIPGLEGTGFYGYGLGGDVDSPDPRKREPRTSESPGSYMKMIDIVRSRGLLWADEDARIACLALEGRKAEVAIVRERAESDPVNGDYYRMILRYAGLYPEIYGVWKWYNAAKRKLGAWDFSDTLYAYWKHSQDAFKAVWVDEFQDNTWIQLQICMDAARRGGGVMAGIGDVRQSVFSFSGAAPAIARELPRLLPTATLEIRTNFRSWRRIVMLGNAVAAGKTWMVGSPSIPARRSDGNLYAGEIEVKQALTTAECADLIAEEMQGQLANGVSPSNLCALVRLNAHGDLLEMACLRAGVPAVRVGQSRSFFDGAIARDVLAYLRLVTHRGSLADVAEDLERIANGPKHARRKLPKEQFSKAVKAAVAKQLGVMEGVRWIRRNAGDFKNARGRGINTRGLDELLDDLESFPTEWGQELLRAVMPMVVDPRTLREKAEEPTAAAENGEDGTEAPVDGAEAAGEVEEESDNDDGGTARSIFETLRLLIERFPEPDAFFAFVKSLSKDVMRFNKVESAEAEAKYAEAKAARVTISSCHRAKGLQWKHVYVLVDGSRWPHPRADLDEETRLFYVAVTRAEDALTLVYPRYRDSEATKPAEVSTFVGETVTFMERERYIYEVLAEAQKAGWSPPDDIQVAIASNRIVWHHPENPAWTAQWEPEHAGISDGSFTVYEPEKPPRTLPVDQVLAYLADPGAFTSEAPPAPPPPASTPPSRTRAMERWEAFVAWVTEHDPALLPYVDAARDWLDEPDVSEQDITRVLGWSTLADLTTLVRALCPMEGPAVRWAKSPWAYMTAFDYRGSEIVGWRGSTPVNLAGASKVWGSEIKGKVSWSTGGRPDVIGGTGVRPEQVPGLRLLAYLDAGGPDAPSATPRPVSSVSDAVLVGNVLVESNPAQPGMFRMRLQDSDALLGAGSDRALLIRDATLLALAQERGVDPLTITEAPGDGSLSFRVVVTAREQSWDHHVTADSVAAALGRAIRLTHPEAPLRWCAYPADGQTTFTDPSGATYVAMPTGAAVPAPSSVQRVEKPVVATRQREVGTLTLPARGDWQMVMGLSTSGTPLYESVRKTIPVRAGSIVLGAHIEVDDRENARRGTRMEAFRVAVTDGVASLVLVGSYVAETHSYEAAVQRINEFYGIVRAAIEPVWAADALQAKLSTTSVLPNVAALARALWEIAPEGGITAAPNGRIQVPPNTLLRRSGTNDLLPALVDSGVLIVVGDTYAWGV